MISAGIDAGAATTKAVILKDNAVAGYTISSTGFDFLKASKDVYRDALKSAGLKSRDVEMVWATGYGKNSVKFPARDSQRDNGARPGRQFFIPRCGGHHRHRRPGQ